MIKKKTDVKTEKSMTLSFTFDIIIDSSIDDPDLPSAMKEWIKSFFNNDRTGVTVKRVVRGGDGVIQHIDLNFWAGR